MKNKSESGNEVGLEVEKNLNIPNHIKMLCPKCKSDEMVIVGGKKTFCPKCDNHDNE